MGVYEVTEGQRVYTVPTSSCMEKVAWSPKALVLAYGGEDKKEEGGTVHVLGLV